MNSRLGRALVLHESARRSTDSRGPEAEIDHLGSFREAKWPGRGPDPSSGGLVIAVAASKSWKYKHFRASTRIYGLRGDGA